MKRILFMRLRALKLAYRNANNVADRLSIWNDIEAVYFLLNSGDTYD